MWFFWGNNDKKSVCVESEKKLEEVKVKIETKGTQTDFPEIKNLDNNRCFNQYKLEVAYFLKIIDRLELEEQEVNLEDMSMAREIVKNNLQRTRGKLQKIDNAAKSIHEKTIEFTRNATEFQQNKSWVFRKPLFGKTIKL